MDSTTTLLFKHRYAVMHITIEPMQCLQVDRTDLKMGLGFFGLRTMTKIPRVYFEMVKISIMENVFYNVEVEHQLLMD